MGTTCVHGCIKARRRAGLGLKRGVDGQRAPPYLGQIIITLERYASRQRPVSVYWVYRAVNTMHML